MTTATTFSRQNDAASRASATLRKSRTRRLSYSSSFSSQNKLSNIQRLLLLLKHTSSPFNTSDPSLSLSSSFFFWQSASALETLKLNTNKQFKLLDKNKNYGYYDTKLKNKTKQNSTTFYVTDRGRKPHDSEFFALFQNLVIPLKITTPGEFAQAIFDKLSGVISTKFHFGSTCTGADPGFFLGGGALVSCSTSTPINHIVFWGVGGGQNTSCVRKPQVISGGGGAHPVHPPPRSAPDVTFSLPSPLLLLTVPSKRSLCSHNIQPSLSP